MYEAKIRVMAWHKAYQVLLKELEKSERKKDIEQRKSR